MPGGQEEALAAGALAVEELPDELEPLSLLPDDEVDELDPLDDPLPELLDDESDVPLLLLLVSESEPEERESVR